MKLMYKISGTKITRVLFYGLLLVAIIGIGSGAGTGEGLVSPNGWRIADPPR